MTGFVTSIRPGREQHAYESSLERDLLRRLDFDRRVESFEAQPMRVKYTGPAGKARSYTPDVLAHLRSQKRGVAFPSALLYEVKYEAELEKRREEFAPRFEAARLHAEEKGWKFEVVTETDIRTPFLENANFLRPLARDPIQMKGRALNVFRVIGASSSAMTAQRAALEASRGKTSGSGHNQRQAYGEALRTVWRLLARGHIEADLHSARVTGESRVWIAEDTPQTQ